MRRIAPTGLVAPSSWATEVVERNVALRAPCSTSDVGVASITSRPPWNLEHRFIFKRRPARGAGRSKRPLARTAWSSDTNSWHAALHEREINQVVATRKPVRGEVPFNDGVRPALPRLSARAGFGSDGEARIAGTSARRHRSSTSSSKASCSRPIAARTSSSRRSRTSCAIRSRRSATRSSCCSSHERPSRPGARSREMIERQVKHMVRLVDDLLDVSRITRGKIELRKRARRACGASLDDALETSAPADRRRAGHRSIVELPGEPTAWSMPIRLRLAQVFANLLDNAAKYTRPAARIALTCASSGDDVAVSVRDNGIGIATEALPRVFDLFTQVHPSDRIKPAASASASRWCAVWSSCTAAASRCAAKACDRAASSSCTLPRPWPPRLRAPQAGERRARRRRPPPARAGRRRQSRRRRQPGDAARAASVHRGARGVRRPAGARALESFEPAVALLDIGMPGMDGYEVGARMRASPPGPRTPCSSRSPAGARTRTRARARDAGFDEHLTKPVDPDLLAA